MKCRALLVVSIVAFNLSGCATILAGKTQNVSIQTNPPGANCTLTREGMPIGSIPATPGGMVVNKTKHDISVVCKKSGYQDATGYLKSGTEGATFGNIIAGGVIGWGVDSASGADNKYPEVTTISLAPVEHKNSRQTASYKRKTEVLPEFVDASEEIVQPKLQPTSPTTKGTTTTVAGRLQDLEELKNKGLVNEQEYRASKDRILANL
jgi:hypothetical protein